MQTKLVLIALLFLAVNIAAGAESDARFFGGDGDGHGGAALEHARSLDGGPQVSLWSASLRTFLWTDADVALEPVSIGAWEPLSMVTNGGVLKICVPSNWQCRFDPDAVIAVGGVAADKIGAPSFATDGRALLLPVSEDFAAGDVVTVTGLKIVDLHLCRAGTRWLELFFTDGAVADVYDECWLQSRVLLFGGSYDHWGTATSDPSVFYVPGGSIISVR
jgi:hypothetical protein